MIWVILFYAATGVALAICLALYAYAEWRQRKELASSKSWRAEYLSNEASYMRTWAELIQRQGQRLVEDMRAADAREAKLAANPFRCDTGPVCSSGSCAVVRCS